MRCLPRMVIGGLLMAMPVACTEPPKFMREDEGSGLVVLAGQFAQGSMFRNNQAPQSAYEQENPRVAGVPQHSAAAPVVAALPARNVTASRAVTKINTAPAEAEFPF